MTDQPAMIDSGASAYYSDGRYLAEHKDTNSSFKVQLVLAMLKRQGLTFGNGMNIAEVGCGQGSFLFPLATHLNSAGVTASFVGYDISAPAIALATARCRGVDGLRFEVGSTTNVPGGLDFVFLVDVLEHVENPAAFLRSLRGKARYVVLHLPVEHSFAHLLLRKPTESDLLLRHVQFYSYETSELLLRNSPFRVVTRQLSAGQYESIRAVRGLRPKISGFARLLLYRAFPRYAPLIVGGSVMWLLEDRSVQSGGP